MLQANRVRISAVTTNKLRRLKQVTGLTPNISCRIAICLSLREKRTYEPVPLESDGQEFNKPTLLGDWETLVVSLLKQYLIDEDKNSALSEETLIEELRYHIARGVSILAARIRGFSDITLLISSQHNSHL